MKTKIEVGIILKFFVVMYTISYLFRKIAMFFLKPELQAFYHKIRSSPKSITGKDIFHITLMQDFVRNTIFPLQIISIITFVLLLSIQAWRIKIKEFVIAYIVLMVLLLIF